MFLSCKNQETFQREPSSFLFYHVQDLQPDAHVQANALSRANASVNKFIQSEQRWNNDVIMTTCFYWLTCLFS